MNQPSIEKRITRVVIWAAGAVALAYLITVHRPHLLEWLPYLIILACPLMHLFMHRKHHHHDDSNPRDDVSHH